jgi:hypothetical protein
MISQAIFNTAFRFGVGYVSLQAALLLMSRWMNTNPYGPLRMWMLYLLPVFIFLAIKYLKQFEIGKQVGFGGAFRTGSMTTLIGGAASSMLLYVYGMISGPELLARHVTEMQEVLEATQGQFDDMFGKENMSKAIEQMKLVTPASLAYEDFFMKLVFGTLVSLIIAFFFRNRHTSNA